MEVSTSQRTSDRMSLKEASGWFAAGNSFRCAMRCLSDGAFKLFTHVCLEADRYTGCYEATQTDLAQTLGKSRRIIGAYISELETKKVCMVRSGRNQFRHTVFEIREDYWPYKRLSCPSVKNPVEMSIVSNTHTTSCATSPPIVTVAAAQKNRIDMDRYVRVIRRIFLTLGCTHGIFRPADEEIARDFYDRKVLLSEVLDALVLGAVRKLAAWLNGRKSGAITSLKYFDPIVEEVAETDFPEGYRWYLRWKLKGFRKQWSEQQMPRTVKAKALGSPD